MQCIEIEAEELRRIERGEKLKIQEKEKMMIAGQNAQNGNKRKKERKKQTNKVRVKQMML